MTKYIVYFQSEVKVRITANNVREAFSSAMIKLGEQSKEKLLENFVPTKHTTDTDVIE